MQLGPAWIYDGSEIPDPFGYGERAVEFLRFLKHPKSRAPDRSLTLDPWQERIVRMTYGPCHADGRRIARTVVLLVPRGNRKTALGAGLALLHTFGPERVPGGQVVAAAADRKQARLAYEEALGIVAEVPQLAGNARPQDFKNRLVHPKSGATLEAISADADTQHGRTPIFVLADEIHAWKNRKLFDVLRTGLVKVAGSLLVIITTAGRGQENVAWQIIEDARRVARGEVEDPGILPILFEAPRDCDWRDEEIWHAVNPGLAHGYPDLEGLRQLAREAERRPADREAFRQLHLNIWLDHSVDPFVDMDVYDEGAEPVDLEALKGEPCWLAVDLGLTTDLTAVVAAWRDGDDGYAVAAWFFCPADNLRARADRDGVPYPQWAQQGFITPTPGNVTDYRTVEMHLRGLCEDYHVREIAFDPAYAQAIMAPLQEDGFPVVAMRQGWMTMAPAVKELERVIIGRKLGHGGNPVLRWNFDNVAVETDRAGNRMMTKAKSRDRIDGAVATAMAIARASVGDSGSSIYADIEERPVGLLFV